MFEFQTQLIFPTHAVGSAGPLPPGAERVQLKLTGGEVLHGVMVPPTEPARKKTLVIGFAGNAWNSENAADFLHEVYPAAHIVAFHYRGYRPSTGSPSAEALLADAPLVYDFAAARVRPSRSVAVGLSIGSGVAADLATKRPLDGVILVTPFDSLKAVAQGMYPWLPIGPLFKHEIDAAGPLKGSPVRVAIVAAERDQIIPPARTDALRRQVKNLVFDRTIAGAGHNDIYSHGEFHHGMRDALAAVTG